MRFGDVYRGATVLVTGHTGFKGSWLCQVLLELEAEVVGYALDPPTEPSLFEALGLAERLVADLRGDVRSLDGLLAAVRAHSPDLVFHLAAQPLVREAYDDPVGTVDTNVMGTVHVLEAVRRHDRECVVVSVTTDKVYDNREWLHAYRESDPLGGHDPYSASKACAEILAASYRRSFFAAGAAEEDVPRIVLATARGGNVLGGGDWATDRIVPDCIRHLGQGRVVPVRNRLATRPWQHVLDLLDGYLTLGSELALARRGGDGERLRRLCSAFNFGPGLDANRTVEALVNEILRHWPGSWEDQTPTDAKHEAGKLDLAIDKAHHLLGWGPRWDFEQTVARTVAWYRAYGEGGAKDANALRQLTRDQIRAHAEHDLPPG